jgi:D-inositol-3-phosphate glycosyltransferase
MRIALVADDCSPLTQLSQPDDHGFGAQTARVSSLAQALARLGHRITIYARKDSTALPGSAILAPGVTVEHLTAGPPASLGADELARHLSEFSSCLAQRWHRSPPDIAHAHSWSSGLAALAGARDLGVPVAQTFGALAAAQQRHRVQQCPSPTRIRLEPGIARRADVVLAGSTDELADLARLGVSRARVRMVPCGVDTQWFTPDGPAAPRNGRSRLLAAAPLTTGSGLHTALRALAEIPGAELVVTGGPDPGQLSRDSACRDLDGTARGLGVRDRLVFTGPIVAGDLPALLRSADLLVSTAPYEPAGVVAIQAMACGTPVVATTAGAEQDAVLDSTTGLLMPAGHPAEFARRIRRLLGNSMQLEAYGIAAADRARSRYSWERIARETLAAYSSCPRRPAAARAEAAEPLRAPADGARQLPAGARV